MANSKFQSGSGKYTCTECGKETRETGAGESKLKMCRKCMNECELENEHSDDGHEAYEPDCPACRSDRADAIAAQMAASLPNVSTKELAIWIYNGDAARLTAEDIPALVAEWKEYEGEK